MLDLVAKELFLTRGKGVHEDRLTSFEFALRDAGIAGTNIVLISSIFPPHAKLVSRKEGLKKLNLDRFYLQYIQRIKLKNLIEFVLLLLVLRNQKINPDMDICLNTNLLVKMKCKQAIMQRILLLKC
ncbi:MAG: putative Arginine decarboxylase [Nitrosopumilus sp.]|nr:putative Arginine decarboxylase [Candidatus Nitrosopumilus limneticus]